MFESLLFALLPLYALTSSEPGTGVLTSIWEPGALCYTAVVIAVNIKVSRCH